jgi:putative ABC transport system permease protein
MFGSFLAVGWAAVLSWERRLGRERSIAQRLAWRNFTRDRVRLLIAVAGVAFAVLLMTLQLGLLIGFAMTSSSLVDRATADFWVVPRGAKDVDQAGLMLERQKFAALGIPEVASVESAIVLFAGLKRPDGGTESVLIVGVEPDGTSLQPWNFILGSPEDLHRADGIVIDELYAGKLGVSKVGQALEITSRRARVVGITSGIRTFTQSPYVFTSLENARKFGGVPAGWTTYLLVRAKRGADLARLQRSLQAALPLEDVWTSHGFSWQTREYWLFTTGAGSALLVAAILGLIVGAVIVAQTLYSAAVERMQEFAAIRAMGANNKYLTRIILHQAAIGGMTGYAIGTAVSVVLVALSRHSSVALILPFSLMVIMVFITLSMCAGASLIPIRRVLRADPASIFR